MKYNFKSITLSLGLGCNLNCSYCQINKINTEIMSKETIDKSLKWIKENVNDPFISFFGGEPLLHYETIKDIIKNNPEINYGISTNLTLLTPERIKFFFDHKVKLLLSIDGFGEVHNLSRNNSWEKFANLLPILGELFPEATFRITLTPENIKYLTSTIYQGYMLGFSNFYALPNGMDDQWDTLSYDEMKKQLNYLWNDVELRKLFKPFNDYKNRLEYPENQNQCCDGKTTIAILPNGKISLCGEQTENNLFLIGDVDNGIDQNQILNFQNLIKPCPINCKANPICSKERCFSRRVYNYNDLNHRIVNHCRWYNTIIEVMN